MSGDDGSPDRRLAAALAGWREADGAAARAEVLAALSGARVFVAVAARSVGTTTSGTTGLPQESTAEMALLSVQRPDGARALPVFTDGHEVQRWRAEARPVPVPGPDACAAALDDGVTALVLDPSDTGFVVDAGELGPLAAGEVPVPGSSVTARARVAELGAPSAPVDPALLAALGVALAEEPVSAARVLEGADGLVLGVVLDPPPAPAALAALGDRVGRRLGPHLPAAGLDLTALPAAGPGQPVPLRQARRRRLFARRR